MYNDTPGTLIFRELFVSVIKLFATAFDEPFITSTVYQLERYILGHFYQSLDITI